MGHIMTTELTFLIDTENVGTGADIFNGGDLSSETADGAGLSFLEALALAETSAPGGAILETSGLGEDATLITTLSAPLTLTSSFTFNGLAETTASDPLPTVVNINSNVGFANLAGNGTVFSNIASDFIFLDNSTGFVSSCLLYTSPSPRDRG